MIIFKYLKTFILTTLYKASGEYNQGEIPRKSTPC